MGSLCIGVNLHAAVNKIDQGCHGNATIGSFCIHVNLHATVNNTKAISVAMKTQQWVSFALMLTYMQL